MASDLSTLVRPAQGDSARKPQGPLFILTLACDDKIGIVAAMANFLVAHDCNIVESAQFNDHENGRFFARIAFSPLSGETLDSLRAAFAAVADKFGAEAHFYDAVGQAEGADPGLQAGPLPERPVVPQRDRRPADRHRRRGVQPPPVRAADREPWAEVRLSADHARDQAAAGSQS